MGRRRKQASTSDMLLSLPWWMLAIGSAASYLIFHNILPVAFGANPLLSAIGMLARGLAWMPALLLGFFAVLSYLRERSRQADARLGPPRTEPTGRARPPKAPPQPARNAAGSNTPNPPNSPNTTRNTTTPTQAPTPAEPATPQSWTLEAIQSLEWKRFELLCVQYYEQMGFAVKTVPHGPDGGIDATLYKAGLDAPVAVVQCKAWSKPVKVEQVRALGGSMLAHKVKRGVFWSLSGYVGNPVQEFSELAGIQLLDGPAVLERIRALAEDKQAALLAKVFEGDYRTPSCPACGVKLVARNGRSGAFWGCVNYHAGCRYKLRVKSTVL
ncbi:restriction endonuclease [Ralstonia mojiangensis]|uniref:restriction endonuclease n=1 Tax=Ralstonia mojiangensis TaxID=2953895 RepID=UPI0021B20992|nr:restriction endonuclease [Ralstonia mojiangensis]MCT7327458.1 restriction endonuclease [Ralstonia mojiangensis]